MEKLIEVGEMWNYGEQAKNFNICSFNKTFFPCYANNEFLCNIQVLMQDVVF